MEKKIIIRPGITTGTQAVKMIETSLRQAQKTLKEFSKHSGISKVDVSDWRHGRPLSLGKAVQLARGLKWLGLTVVLEE